MSEPTSFKYRIGGGEPEPLLIVKADGQILMRSAAGQLVAVKLPAKAAERIRQCGNTNDGTLGVVRVLCEIMANEFPAARPS